MEETPTLFELMRAAQDPGDPARRLQARNQVLRLVMDPISRYVRRKLGNTQDAEDVAQNALVRINRNIEQCRGTARYEPDSEAALTAPQLATARAQWEEAADKQCWSWVFWTTRGRISEHLRKKRRERELEQKLKLEARGQLVTRREDQTGLRARSILKASQAFRQLIATGAPTNVLEQARKAEAPMTEEYFQACLNAWIQVRVGGVPTWDLGSSLGFQGEKRTIQARVSRMIKRGATALEIGAGLAAETEPDGSQGADLLKLRDALRKPMKKQRKKRSVPGEK